MSDETSQYILGDAAADAVSHPRRRGWFGRRKKQPPPLTRCENCETPLSGPYCSQCGQHAIDYRRSFMTVVIDAADSFFDWDTKFMHTMAVLLTRPGKLTNDFNAGRRMRYMHPLRLYLMGSIAFFLMARLINLAPSTSREFTAADRAELDATLSKLTAPDSPLRPEQRAKLETVRARFADPSVALGSTQQVMLSKMLERLPPFAEKEKLTPKDERKLEGILDLITRGSATPPPLLARPDGKDVSTTNPFLPEIPAPAATPAIPDTPGLHFDGDDNSEFGRWIEGRVRAKIGENGTKAQLFVDTLRGNIPTMMLFCIPLFALVLKILYVFQRRFYIEHLVYALHIHTFAYMAAIIVTLVEMGAVRVIPSLRGWLVAGLTIAAAVEVFLSIRRVYKQGWLLTTCKFFLGGFVYLVILVLAVGATAFVTLLLPD